MSQVKGDPRKFGGIGGDACATVIGPYMHAGSLKPLGDVLDHYAAGGQSARACHRSPLTSPLVSGFAMAETEKAELIAFLEALTDYSFLANPEHQSPFR